MQGHTSLASAFNSDHVPDAEPSSIAALWAYVNSTKSSMASQGSRRGKDRARRLDLGEAGSSASASQSLFEPAESENTPGSTLSNTRSITPRSSKFSQLILHPRGIYVNDTNSIVPSAFSHFDKKPPPRGYRSIEGLDCANIWITMDDGEAEYIAGEYKEMKGLGLCEEEFATIAKETFLRRESRSADVSLDRQWRAERMLQLVCPPKENAHWRIPPIIGSITTGEVGWTWDIRPDCAYWLSLKGFNPEYRFQIQNCAFVREWITCPYFTVEFKRDGQSEDVAVRQVAAAGSLALFNRYHLNLEARKANPGLADAESNIRHYTLTFVGPRFVFWVIRPTVDDGRWNGCSMTRLVGADCTDVYGVRELVKWINEIHRWGLSEHGPGCERDIKAVLKLGGVRTSDIHESLSSAT